MNICNAFTSCFTGQSDDDATTRSNQQIATDVIDTLQKAEKNGVALRQDLEDIVSDSGWTENLAAAVLNGLENVIKAGTPMGTAMKEAFEHAIKEAADFAHDHPAFCTLVALGILVALVPWAVTALGFGELGPIEGELS